MKQIWNQFPFLHKLAISGVTVSVFAMSLWPADNASASKDTSIVVEVALPDFDQQSNTASLSSMPAVKSQQAIKQQPPIKPSLPIATVPVVKANPKPTSEVSKVEIQLADSTSKTNEKFAFETTKLQSSEPTDNHELIYARNLNDNLQHKLALQPGIRYELPLALSSETALQTDKLDYQTRVITVRKNDNLAKIFEREKLSAKSLLQVSKSGKSAKTLIKRLKPGDELELKIDNKQQLSALTYQVSANKQIQITKTAKGYQATTVEKSMQSGTDLAHAEISSNFWNAGITAGLSETQIMNLADIFGWDIDFALDIRKGDSFNVVFEQRYVDGEYIGPGNILAAEFINQGETFAAIRHTDGNYYTPEGRSMRKAFLRAPVNFKYISSSFNPRRLHPVTGKVRPHRGIDYAARTGTPVVAAGNGKVIKSGYNRLNGNYVFIQHGEKYVTKYLHLHKRYVKKYSKVKQGQKIGTVGATGRVTGAHLHYEFLVNGIHRNPRTVKLPKSMPIDRAQKAAFAAISTQMRELLDTNKRILLAMNQ